MKRLALTVAAILLSAFATAVPAQADTPGCVTRAEYRHVHKGMTKERVHRIFDARAHRAEGIDTFYYNTCKPNHFVLIEFRRYSGALHLHHKYWFRQQG